MWPIHFQRYSVISFRSIPFQIAFRVTFSPPFLGLLLFLLFVLLLPLLFFRYTSQFQEAPIKIKAIGFSKHLFHELLFIYVSYVSVK